MKAEPFLKVPHSLIDNEVLTTNEKCLYMLLTRLRTAKKGCVPSYAYLKKKLNLRDNRTVLKALDRLQIFGYITWKNRGKNKSNKYYFRGDTDFQSILQDNLRLRKLCPINRKLNTTKKLGITLLKRWG